jgi:hypothetical protein
MRRRRWATGAVDLCEVLTMTEKDCFIPSAKVTIHLTPIEDDVWKSVFWWNDGEMDSEQDYEIPLVGFGSTSKEAIGDLIEKYDELKRNPPPCPLSTPTGC